MARKSQAERINFLASIVEQLALRFAAFVSVAMDDADELVAEINEMAIMAQQVKDEKAFDLVMNSFEQQENQQ